MRRTATHLSDGRELIYFDGSDAPARAAIDRRGLPPGSTSQGVMRFDALAGEWVAIAGHRQTRTFLPSASECPLCPSDGDNLSEIPESSYEVVVFENRFPSFLLGDVSPDTALSPAWGVELPAHGRCEVVAFSQEHGGSIAALMEGHMSLVMAAWIDRTRELSELDGIRYVFVFENRGAEVGVTLHHPHGQIYAYPYVPPAAATILREAGAYRERTDRSLIADVVDAEIRSGDRVIYRDDEWVAFVPYAARWPFEIHVHPVRDCASLADLTSDQCASFCAFYPRLIRALDAIFEAPLPYMSGWIQRPAHATAQETRDSRLFLRLISNRRAADKLKYLAGSEALMGAFINDMSPEATAQLIRDVLVTTT